MHYNVILKHVRETLLPWKSSKYYITVCVPVRACVRAFVCPSAPPASPHFSKLSHKRHNFLEKGTEYKMCVFILSKTFP